MEEELVGEVAAMPASQRSAPPPRHHALPVCTAPRRRPLPQRSATVRPRCHPPPVRAGTAPQASFRRGGDADDDR
jgi:hypothetical protein